MDGNDTENVESQEILDIELHNKFPNIQGFGLDIAGGVDRPFDKVDSGIFVSAVKEGGLAKKCGLLEVGDKIIEVNGQSVVDAKHDDVVQLFIADRSLVTLRVHKNRLQILRAASKSPTSSGAVSPQTSPPPQSPTGPPESSTLSISGFLVGIALGCVSVVLLRRYLASGKA